MKRVILLIIILSIIGCGSRGSLKPPARQFVPPPDVPKPVINSFKVTIVNRAKLEKILNEMSEKEKNDIAWFIYDANNHDIRRNNDLSLLEAILNLRSNLNYYERELEKRQKREEAVEEKETFGTKFKKLFKRD